MTKRESRKQRSNLPAMQRSQFVKTYCFEEVKEAISPQRDIRTKVTSIEFLNTLV
ncbi:hypothetical protein [Porphyromonas pogonae]|uniref:hypothetical protein n=1 Tax=Porphyromonas pogonae TaxID=867595 RepID=UPI002E7A30AC|nr:hypothetical protein [Porphyromonas pogonae]